MGEKELLNQQEKVKDVDTLYIIDLYKCGILVHALEGLSTPQTLKIVGYIKNKRSIVSIESCSAHNFIDKRLS